MHIDLEWKGKSYTIPSDEAFDVGEKVEDVVTLVELQAMSAAPKFHKLARAYAVLLNHAGARVTPQEIHAAMLDQVKDYAAKGVRPNEVEAKQVIAARAVAMLITILMDGAPASDGDEGNSPAVS